MKTQLTTLILVVFACIQLNAQSTEVDINFDVKHTVGGVSTFEREKFMIIHGSIIESDWNGEEDKLDYLLNDLDLYLGRATGPMKYQSSLLSEDTNSAKKGYASETDMQNRGNTEKNRYENQFASRHIYEPKIDMVVAAQQRPFYPDGTLTNKGWAFATDDPLGKATGHFMGNWLKYYFDNGNGVGEQRPEYVEVVNEPVWDLVEKTGVATLEDIFNFHNNVADEIKSIVPNTKVGGYTTAFPNLEENNFQRWNDRWKKFIDMSGDKMDFYSIHLYDFPIKSQQELYRKGSNMEATMDMIEHYNYLTRNGEVKPFLISEYGAQIHDLFGTPWDAHRDWYDVKTFSSMMIQFMERPNNMIKCIPFIPLKAEWGRSSPTVPYTSRLLRQKKEGAGETGDEWVFTGFVKFYELWADVRGTRVDTKANDLDIQVDAFVNGNKGYVILNNLDFQPVTVNLNELGISNNTIQQIKAKHLYLASNNVPVLDTVVYSNNVASVVVETEATMVLEYTFNNNVAIGQTSNETKYYADGYLKAINANQTLTYNINGVNKGSKGEAVLRLGVGRNHGKSLLPTVLLNGSPLSVPNDFRGGEQVDRDTYFGVIEIPVPHSALNTNNNVEITFPDNGGHISSLTMQVYNFSREIERFNSNSVVIEIEAEDFDSTGSPNGADSNGNLGVKRGTSNISWVNADDWVAYNINIQEEGLYEVEYMTSTPNNGSSIELVLNNDAIIREDIPNTGGWNTMQYHKSSAKIHLTQGNHTIKLVAGSNAWEWNMDKFKLTRVSGLPSNRLLTVQAEDFDNTGSPNGPDTGGYQGVKRNASTISFVNADDWITYDINIPESGIYQLEYQITTPVNNSTIQVQLNSQVISTDNVANTGSWSLYQGLMAASTLNISAGTNQIKLVAGSNAWEWNLDSFTLTRLADLPSTSSGSRLSLSVKSNGSHIDDILVYPIPVKDGILNIEFDYADDINEEIRIYNIQGIQIISKKIKNSNKLQIDFSNYPKGVYMLRTTKGITKRVLVE